MNKNSPPNVFNKRALAFAIGLMTCSHVFGMENPDDTEASESNDLDEIVVYGVRASQAKSIDIKRNSTTIVDSIVAEDIGKLPDMTITDSLQRITGVQIKREANEGTSLNVRGMPQVMTTLNGEQFLSPWTITNVGANYSDVPAGVISGVDVFKSQSASHLSGGISGAVDLKTFRPLALSEGITVNARGDASMGTYTNKKLLSDGTYDPRSPDHNVNVFVGYNKDSRLGVALGLSDSTSYAANYQIYEDQRLAFLDGPGGSPGDPYDLDNQGTGQSDSNLAVDPDWYLVPAGFGARSNYMDRDRTGATFSVEAEINENFQVRGDIFYTRMDQFDRGVKAAFNGTSSIWAYNEQGRHLLPDENGEYSIYSSEVKYYTREEMDAGLPAAENAQDAYNNRALSDQYDSLQPGSVVGYGGEFQYVDRFGVTQNRTINTLRVAEVLAPDFLSTSTSQINRTAAVNSNLELLYTNNDNFNGSVRFVYAEAEKQFRNAQFIQGTPAWLWVDTDGGDKDPLNTFSVTVDYRSEIPSFSYDADISDPDTLEQYQGFADGENTDASLSVFRADGEYAFLDSNLLESLEFGIRRGVRKANHSKFFYVSPTARYSTWDDPRVSSDKRYLLRTGNARWAKYPEWLRFNFEDNDPNLINVGGLEDNGFSVNNPDGSSTGNIIAFSDFGPIKGFEGGVSALNPKRWDNPLAFLNSLYPGTRSVADPGLTYGVTESSTSLYSTLNFDGEFDPIPWPFNGNIGLRVIQTDREVVKSVVPEVLDKFNSIGYDDWQRIAFVSTKETIKHSYTDVLPSVNLNFFPSDDLIVRFGAAKTTTRNDLNNVGSGVVLWYQQCVKTDEEGRTVQVRDGGGNFVDELVSCVGGGNDQGRPDIKPWYAKVFNTSAEWYFADNAILGAGLFLIKVDSSVETAIETRPFVDGDGIDRGRRANVWVSRNASASDLTGLELGYKQPFTFFENSFLASTGIEFNYTYSNSKSKDHDLEGKAFPLQSNSKHQTNFILWYDKDGLNARLAYNWRSKEYLGRVGINTNEAAIDLGNWLKPTGYLDFSVNYQVNEYLNVFFNGTNLTEQHRFSYSQYEDQFHSFWAQERRFSLGVSFSLK